jgi:Cu+-exporting ATPase
MAKDPICGMTVDEATALSAEREGQTFYFCSEHCRQKFLSQTAPRSTPLRSVAEAASSCCGGNHADARSDDHTHRAHAHHNAVALRGMDSGTYPP